MVVLGAHQLYSLAAPTAGVFAEANLAAVASSGVFCLVFLWFLHHADRYERTPGRLALAAFVGGGLGAPWAMALPGNGAMMDLYAKTLGQAWASDWKAGLTAPFVEETAKGIVFVLLLGLAPVVIRTVYDGLIVGAYVGLGLPGARGHALRPEQRLPELRRRPGRLGDAHLRPALRLGRGLARDVHRDLRCRHRLPRRNPRPATPGRARPGAHGGRDARPRHLGLDARPGRRQRLRRHRAHARHHHRQRRRAVHGAALGRRTASAATCATCWPPRSPTAPSPTSS